MQREGEQAQPPAHHPAHDEHQRQHAYGRLREVPRRNVVLLPEEGQEEDGQPDGQHGRPVGYEDIHQPGARGAVVKEHRIRRQQHHRHGLDGHAQASPPHLLRPQVQAEGQQRAHREEVAQAHQQPLVVRLPTEVHQAAQVEGERQGEHQGHGKPAGATAEGTGQSLKEGDESEHFVFGIFRSFIGFSVC